MRWALLVFMVALAGCRHSAYTLARQGRTLILSPPKTSPEIKNARRHPAQTLGCDASAGPFSLAWRGNTAVVAAKAEEYFAPPVDPLKQPGPVMAPVQETGPRMYADALADVEKFRDAIAATQKSGCLREPETAALHVSMTERLKLPTEITAYLRFGTYRQTGFVDLNEGAMLSVTSPREGGFDISFYAVKKDREGGQTRIALVAGDGKALMPPATPGFYRYLYWTGASSHNFRATLLGAGDRMALEEASRGFLKDPEAYCAHPGPGVFCQTMSPQAGMNAGFYVKVNGVDTFARVGGTVGEVLTEGSGLAAVRSGKKIEVKSVRRKFGKKMIPVKYQGAEILGLVVMPGDEIQQ